MISDTFRHDYERMTAEGVKFTPEDIIRLNALALKVKLSGKAFGAAHLPRAIFLDDGGVFRAPLVLRQPTLAHELWIERTGAFMNLADNRTFRLVYAFALSREAIALPSPLDRRRVVKAVFSFASRRLGRLTYRQLADAIDYVLFGPDWMAGEIPPSRAAHTPSDQTSPALGVMIGAVARRLALSLDDLGRLTCDELTEAVQRARYYDDDFDAQEEMKARRGDYVRAREEIRARA